MKDEELRMKNEELRMNSRKLGFFLFIIVCLLVKPVSAQEFSGINGMMNTPTAETDSAGTFRGGFYFINSHPRYFIFIWIHMISRLCLL